MESEFSPEFQAAALKILSSNDDKPMEKMLSNLCSAQEPQRFEAQRFIECCKKLDPFLLVIQLTVLIRCSPRLETRANASRVLRFVRVSDLWSKFSETSKCSLKAHFLALLSEDNVISILRVVCVVISETVSEIYKAGKQWPELLDFLMDCLKKKDERFQETSLLVLAKLPKDCRWLISAALSRKILSLHSLFLKTLDSENPNIKVNTFGAVVSLLSLFSHSSNRRFFERLLRAMIVGISTMLNKLQDNHAKKAIRELTKLVSGDPLFLRPYVNEIVLNMLKFAENPVYHTHEIRCLSINLVITMTELEIYKPVFLNLPHDTLCRLIYRAIWMLHYIEEEMVWIELESEGDTDRFTGELNDYKCGVRCLHKLSIILGGSTIVPVVSDFFPFYLDSSEWKKRYAGVKMLTVITKVLSHEMILSVDFLGKVATKILSLFQDSHFQVRLATFRFMQMPTNFIHAMHTLYYGKLLTAFDTALTDQNGKVQEEAGSATLLFLKNTLPECLKMHQEVDDVMTRFLALFSGIATDKQRLNALLTFNVVAQQCREVVIKHYVNFIPFLLEACNEKRSEVKEEAARGIRICAEFGTPDFLPFIERALLELDFLIKNSRRSLSENTKVHDIAVSALGRICEFHRGSIDGSKLVPAWLSNLPLKYDLDEARIMHEQLCVMVSRSDKDVLGLDSGNLCKIVQVFVEVIENGEKLSTPGTVNQMVLLLKRMWQNLSPSTSDRILLSLDAQQQRLLLRQMGN